MGVNNPALDTVLQWLPDDAKTRAYEHMLRHRSVNELQDTAKNSTTPETILDQLAQHSASSIRRNVALNTATKHDTLTRLQSDTTKTVRDAAEAHLLWRSLASPNPNVPACTPERIKLIQAFAEHQTWRDSHRERVLTNLLCEPTWRTNTTFFHWAYLHEGLNLIDTISSIGASSVLTMLLTSLNDDDQGEALSEFADIVTAKELLDAARDNTEALTRLVTKTVGPNWTTEPLELIYLDWRPDGFLRLALPDISDDVLLEAITPEVDETMTELAIEHARQRPHLHGEIVQRASQYWDENSDYAWVAAHAITGTALLDLPLDMILQPVHPGDAHQPHSEAQALFSEHAHRITAANPDAWDILRVLSNNYKGTGHDMLTAMSHL